MKTIGRYEISQELGQGGMATVFLAHDPYVKRQVAVKVLSYGLAADALHQEYFQREAEAIAALESPTIVPVFDFGWHGTQPYIVMRYMAGGSLAEKLHEMQLSLTELAQIIERVAAGLDAAHKQNIVHRDVKPSNILFDAAGAAYLSDFGLAKFLARMIDEDGEEGLLVGTPAYMSPEQVRGGAIDGRSDVYALGIVLYQALTNRVPYQGRSSLATARAHLTEQPPDITLIRPDLRSAWREIINQALAKDPATRYATAGELALDVREAVTGRWYLRKIF